MSYRLLDKEEIEIFIDEGMIPRQYAGKIDDLHFFARLSDDEEDLYSLAVFSRPDYHTKEAELLYIEVMPEYRNQGLARELLRIAHKSFKSLGIDSLGYELITDRKNENLVRLESLGFEMADVEKEINCYMQGHFAGQQIEMLSDNLDKSGYKFRTDIEFDSPLYKRLLPKLKDEGIIITPRNTELNNSVFAVKDDEIVAALFTKIISDGNVIFRGLYIDPNVSEKMKIIPFLMAKLFEDIELKRDKNKYIFVHYQRENMRQAIETVFGKAETKMVYIKCEYK